jgi:hypothetical protein
MKYIEIIGFSSPHLWYAKFIGQTFKVESESDTFYELIVDGFPKRVWKQDAKEITGYQGE